MIELSVIFGLYVVGSLILLYFKDKTGREERAELELALMALAKPEAAILHRAAQDTEPARVTYVGEPESPGNGRVDLLGDD